MRTQRYIRTLYILVAFLFGISGETWADILAADIIIDNGISNGTVEVSSIAGRTVTLTVTPASGYKIKKDLIVVEKMVDPSRSARRRTPGIGTFDLTGSDSWVSIATDYTFTIPAEYDGAYVTATFVSDEANLITSLDEITQADGTYKLARDINASGFSGFSFSTFSGTLDGNCHTIYGLGTPLFGSINGGTVKNLFFDNVSISGGTNVGTICGEATGDSRIYNCGVLATGSIVETDAKGYTSITSCSSSVSGTNYVGGIVGLLDGNSRVINCFSYANITGGTYVGGIVGYNNVATTSTSLMTMVMNCMFYGDITGGTNKAPIYNGTNIVNQDATGVSNFNYFYGGASYVTNKDIQTYNCALMAEVRYLQRFEFFRNLLNSHLELAGWWATGSYSKEEMLKWVEEPSQIGTSTPYPILKARGKYPSVVNIDVNHSETIPTIGTTVGTLGVTIRMGSGGAAFGEPTGASITTSSLTLNVTDKDPAHFNFNYRKVQLPYYNDVGDGNYTGNRVVAGWKIVGITGGTAGSFTTGEDATTDGDGNITSSPYNFADRNCTNKDLYSVSGRVFNQGAYWDVPEGVTDIIIEPYWAKAVYLADAYPDVVYNAEMKTAYNVPNVGGGQKYTNGQSYLINGSSQVVFTSMDNAIASSGTALFSGESTTDKTVYDYAVVLVGNYHFYGNVSADNAKPYTVTSVDLDGDNEPDYSYILRFDNRQAIHPVRVDFINIPGLGMAQKSTGGTGTFNFGIMQPISWFESTNTSLFRVTQLEYDRSNRVAAPLIVQGGVMEQWVSGQNSGVANLTTYFHVGGNVWFKEFHRGSHQDNTYVSKHPPVSVTGGDYDEFYLTGLYRGDIANYADNAECYINGGRFGIVAGAAQEGLGKSGGADDTGNIVWQIQNADIKEFYGGGQNAAHPVEGNITTVITGGYIKQFCGGPKFGDMNTGKTVKTTATGAQFDTFYGAGYGGNSYSRFAPKNINDINGDYGTANWNKFLNNNYKQEYKAEYEGVSVTYHTQYIPMSKNNVNVARLLVDFVSFSLARTHGVTSVLNNCTINQDFYGGGNLGKVEGDITSTLDGCTVRGNVYGAGYGGSTPTVDVINTGNFVTAPYYDKDLGVYFDPVIPASVEYTWAHRDEEINSTARAIDKSAHILYTNEDLNALGTVTGVVTLTINGSTTAIGGNTDGGNVYGGGALSDVSGDDGEGNITSHVSVNVNDGSMVNVFGGGKGESTVVRGNVEVNIGAKDGSGNLSGSGAVSGNVYGGSAFGAVNASSTKNAAGEVTDYTPSEGKTTLVNIYGGTVTGSVFGGGLGRLAAAGPPAVTAVAAQNFGNTTVNMEGGTASAVYGGANTNGVLKADATVIILGGTVGSNPGGGEPRNVVFGGGYGQPTLVEGNVTVNVGTKSGEPAVYTGTGTIWGNVYGGGALGNVNTSKPESVLVFDATKETKVYLYKGTVNGNVFGGGLGVKATGTYGQEGYDPGVAAYVGGDVYVLLDGAKLGCTFTGVGENRMPVTGQIFGANNLNGTPKGHVKVHVKRTVDSAKPTATERDARTTYDVAAVYGGGNQADYVPTDATLDPAVAGNPAKIAAACAEVIIEGCDETSIEYVYGGGNAAAVPATDVTILGTYIIDYVFGGGNGKSTDTFTNPGANVGIYKNNNVATNYGSGEARTKIVGGHIHVVYGGSNTLGNVRGGTFVTMPDKDPTYTSYDCCEVRDIREIYGAGQNANQDGAVNMILGCVDNMEVVYGGAKDANVAGGINLTITSGHFTAVYGGNNQSGTIQGPITLNIEETACEPIVIDNLYLGGNLAPYSVYGYYEDTTDDNKLKPRTATDTEGDKPHVGSTAVPYSDPVLNVISCTSIGNLFGGGYGAGADLYGNPNVNLNMVPGKWAAKIDRDGDDTPDGVATYLGTIGNVYGGGSAADVHGNTTVNIGTAENVYYTSEPTYLGDKGTDYTEIVEDGPNKGKFEVTAQGARIVGNVYGGGLSATVHGNTQVNIGTKEYTTTGYEGVSVTGNVFGGGQGESTKVTGSVDVTIGTMTPGSPATFTGNASITGDIYGGSALGSVNADGSPLVATGGATTNVTLNIGTVTGSIYGGGLGEKNGVSGGTTDIVSNVYGEVTVTINNGTVSESVYGCNNLNGSPQDEVNVVIAGGTITGNVYGGGNLAAYVGAGELHVTMTGGTATDVFGGGLGTTAAVTGNTIVAVSGGTVTNDVYGGGSQAEVIGETSVTLSGTAAIGNDVYGGGKEADVQQAVTVQLDGGTVARDVYGGGALAQTNTQYAAGSAPANTYTTTVNLAGSTVTGNVYGGGLGRLAVAGSAGSPAVYTAVANGTTLTLGETYYTSSAGAGEFTSDGTEVADGSNYYTLTTPAVEGVAPVAAVEADVNGPVTVTVTDGKATNVFGCNNLNGSPKGTVAVNIEGTTEPNPPITEYSITTVYGGGNLASYTGTGGLSVLMSGGYVNDVFGGGLGSSATVNGSTAVTISGGTVNHDVYGGGSEADVTGSVNVVVSGGKIINDVYGGGALANTNTANWVLGPDETIYVDLTSVMTIGKTSVHGLYTESGGVYTLIDDENAKAADATTYYEKRLLPGHWADGKTSASNTTTVKLTGGTIGNAYGGGLGDEDTPVYVFGDIEIIVNKGADITATGGDGAAFTQNTIDVTVAGQSYTGVPTTGRVFGCNNINGTPMGDVLVEVYSTVNIDAAGNRQSGRKRYEIQAVYGGGNQADYLPDNGKNTTVNIYGCDVTSISRVYGGGNSASVPNTNVTIWGSYDIEYAFGGGNGGQPVKRSSGWVANDGASVSGHAQITCKGGRIGEVFGGSDFKGDCRMSTTTQAQEGSCPLKITKLYGAGKEANVDGSVNVVISACTAENSEVEYVCGGSYKAYISGDVHLTITAGYFKAVYGGNDQRGGINGNIIVDIEETDPCKPIIIKDLVGGGNQAVFPGKDADGNVLPSKSRTITVNVKSATRIDNVYGGSYMAETTADTEVNINMVQGWHKGRTVTLPSDYGVDGAHIPSNITFGGTSYVDVTNEIESEKSVVGYYTRSGEDPNYVYTPASGVKVAETHYYERVVSGTIAETIGTIGNVYGGGQQGQVIGNTTVNIGTKTVIPIMKRIAGVIVDTSDVSIYDGEGKQKPDVEIAYVDETVRGAHIEGDVFGGGEKAEVTGSTNVNICAKETSTDVWASVAEGAEKVTIGGSVYGGGSEADVLTNTTVRMSGGYVYDGVYGGGLMGSVGTFTRTTAVTTESNGYDHSTHADDCVGKPTACTSGGLCKVVVDGGQVGPAEVALADGGMKNTGHKFGLTGPVDVGFVFGAGRGEVLNPIEDYDADFHTYVGSTDVTIGGTAFIMASVYGGGENGRVLGNTSVTIEGNCQIGCGEGKVDGSNKPIRYTDSQWSGENPADFTECPHWDYGKDTSGDDKPDEFLPYDPLASVRYAPGDASTPTDASTTASDGHTYYGNVFGGGSGYYPYEIKNSSGTVVGHDWLRSAGLVEGNTLVNITGGHILTSVYGGNEHSDVDGTCTINMSGGTLGVPRTVADMKGHPVTCYLFGAGKGDQRNRFNFWTNVASTTVNVSGTARIFGSVFGGGEDGHVLGDANVTINGGTIGTTGTSYVDGNVFGGGRGFSGEALTAGVVSGNVNLQINGGTMLGSIYGGGRLASVGTYLVSPGDDRYGTLIPDGYEQNIGGADVPAPGRKHGRIAINITDGTIGNTSLMDQYSGNVYGGCMGRLDLLNGDINPNWSMLALAEATTVNITGGTITRNVYGGGEFGTVRDDAHVTVGGIWDPSEETLTKTGSGTINRNVFGGGYGSDDDEHVDIITVPSYSASYKYTPMQWAGCVGGNTHVNIMGGWVKKTVYGGGELASVGVLDFSIDGSNNYTNIIKHENVNTEFALSWPYKLTFIPNKAGAPVGGKTNVTVTGGRIGITGKDDMGSGVSEDNGDIYGGSKGLAGERYKMAFCANVRETEVTINYNTTNGEACDALPTDYTTTSKKCIAGSVYGGGENGHVMEDTEVTLKAGLIGHAIYGGGKGKDTYKKNLNVVVGSGTYETDVYSITAGKVYGNTNVTMEGGYVMRNIYGGGNMASVGKGNYAGGTDDYYPAGYGEKLAGNLWDNVSDNSKAFLDSGKSTVSITGGTVGTASGEKDDLPTGNIFGGSRGQAAAEVMGIDTNPDMFLGYVNETEVTIGDNEGGSPTIYGSVYGGGQDGHVRRGTSVTIKDGEIGLEHTAANITAVGLKDKNDNDVDLNHFKWKLRGNVYGGGSGIGKYSFDYNGDGDTNDTGLGDYSVNEQGFSSSAGHITHTTSVNVKGGTIHRNVYGGGSLASVCPPYLNPANPPNDNEGEGKGMMSVTVVNVSGGNIGCATDNTAGYGGDVYGACRGESAEGINNDYFAICTQTKTNILPHATERAKDTKIFGNVYGGGELGTVALNTNVNLTGGRIYHDAYGGGKGIKADASGSGVTADVGGNTTVLLNQGVSPSAKGCIVKKIFGCNDFNGTPKGHALVHVFATQNAATASISAKIGPPEYDKVLPKENYKTYLSDLIDAATVTGGLAGDASVITAAQTLLTSLTSTAEGDLTAANKTSITNAAKAIIAELEAMHDYDVETVYGGGDLADYVPTDASSSDPHAMEAARTEVIIEGCDVTSIYQVYGGGNAASSPATDVKVESVYIIDELFGGGNGKDNFTLSNGKWYENGGANVGYKSFVHYDTTSGGSYGTGADEANMFKAITNSNATTPEDRQDPANGYIYGSGVAKTTVTGGHIHKVYGGSNELGNIRTTAMSQYQKSGTCPLLTDETYGGSKNAEIDAEIDMVLDCVESMGDYFGGSTNADINNNVTVNITNGTFKRVFGGNNKAGTINGIITINIEERGCTPIIIDELYGGGYLAPYSVYGYQKDGGDYVTVAGTDEDGNPIAARIPLKAGDTGARETPFRDPHINIVSATSIGSIYGGGYKAKMVASPHINVNMTTGRILAAYKDKDPSYATSYTEATDGTGDWVIPIGTIGNIYGGGNMADIIGNTHVEIGTGKRHNHFNGEEETITPARNAAFITGNVYGGGKMGHVGDFSIADADYHSSHSDVPVGKPYECADGTGTCTVIISNGDIGPNDMNMWHLDGDGNVPASDNPDDAGHVFGAGQGTNLPANDNDAFVYDTHVTINGTAWVKGSVFGGGENGHVLHDTDVTIADNCQIGNGHILVTADDGTILVNRGVNRRYTDAEWTAGHLIVGESEFSDLSSANKTKVIKQFEASLPECDSWLYGKKIEGFVVKPYAHHVPYDKFAKYKDSDDKTYYDEEQTKEADGGYRVASSGRSFNGSVYGGGSGFFPYSAGNWNPKAGQVEGNTTVRVTGGHIMSSLYGGCEMSTMLGNAHVTMSGGTVGVPRTLDEIAAHPVTCYVFGGGKGEARASLDGDTNVQNATVDVTGGWVYGSVFGGAEDGHVLGDATVNISGNIPTSTTTYAQLMAGAATKIGTWGTSYVDGNIFGGGRGFDGHNKKAGRIAGNANINISGGAMLGSIYGGGRLGSVGMGTDGSMGNVYYTQDECNTHNAGLTGAVSTSDTNPSTSTNYTEEQANAHNAGLAGAWKITDIKTPSSKGHININITGGTIGNNHEFIMPNATNIAAVNTALSTSLNTNFKAWNASDWTTWKNYHHVPNTDYDTGNGRLLHTKGGNVFAGCMGRRLTLSGNVIENWTQLAAANSTTLTIGGTAWIMSNVYGGGEFGAVQGYHTTGGKQYGTEVSITSGTIGTEITESAPVKETVATASMVKYTFGSVFGGGYGTEVEHEEATENDHVDKLGALVSGNTAVGMSGGHVRASVFGGGEVAAVGGDTYVTISGGEIGRNEVRPKGDSNPGYVMFGSSTMGNVYGGGKGTSTHPLIGVVKGNTNVTINPSATVAGEPKIYHNVYGGGALGSVGTFVFSDGRGSTPGLEYMAFIPKGIPVIWTAGGKATINILGGTIGISGRDNGMVNGSSRGDIAKPELTDMWAIPVTHKVYKDPYDKMAWVLESEVNIGATGTTGPHIKGSVYGGGENGHVFTQTTVNVKSGIIGIVDEEDPWFDYGNDAINQKAWITRGNVYGAGCGTDMYDSDDDGEEDTHNVWAGCVIGNADVNISGGWIGQSVYGGGSLGSVGRVLEGDEIKVHPGTEPGFALSWPVGFTYQDLSSGVPTGKTTVNITGGRVGTTGSDNGDVFGGSRGEAGPRYAYAQLANVRETEVNIDYPSTPTGDDILAFVENGDKYSLRVKDGVNAICGSVYGGSENGHVNENTKVTLTKGLVGHAIYGGGKGKGTYVRSSDSEEVNSLTAGKVYGNTQVIMEGGHVVRNLYGGGNLASVGKGNYAGARDDFYPDGYGEKLTGEDLWTSSFNPELPVSISNKQDNAWYFLTSGKTDVKVKAGVVGFMAQSLTPVKPSAGDETSFGASDAALKAKLVDVMTKDGLPTGNVFGGCRGVAAAEAMDTTNNVPFFLGYVNETAVTIGDGSGGPRIYGSVYGGCQDGHVRRGTNVTVNMGEIGMKYDAGNVATFGDLLNADGSDNLHWLFRGNIFGGGSGIGKYEDNLGEHPSSSAGSVTHTTNVTVNNGINGEAGTEAAPGNVIYRNVYGGGSLSSVSPPLIGSFPNADDSDGWGKMACNTVNVSGTVGVVDGYVDKYGGEVYGASRGELSMNPNWFAVSVWTKVFIKHGAHIMGNVFGGGDAGAVKKDAKVVVGDNP